MKKTKEYLSLCFMISASRTDFFGTIFQKNQQEMSLDTRGCKMSMLSDVLKGSLQGLGW